MKNYHINNLFKEGYVNSIDLALGRFVQRFEPHAHPWVAATAALVSQAAARGHVCLDLPHTHARGVPSAENDGLLTIDITLDQWLECLKESTTIGRPGTLRPLILDGTRLYLHRLWHYENTLANGIMARIRQKPWPVFDKDCLRATVLHYFRDPADDQFQAAMTAGNTALSIISGGPGSGKTYTIARIMMILQTVAGDTALRIALAAPTGKAAARLHDAVSQGFAALDSDGAPADVSVPKATTLHRLLGYMPSKGGFRYHADHALPVDGVIVDEASMVDLGLMARLMAAMPPRARLILVGDKDQLSSVEAGAVLGDICFGASNAPPRAASAPSDSEPAGDPSALQRRIVVLTQNYRFRSQSGIAALCRVINKGDSKQCLSLLNNTAYPDIVLRPLLNWRDLKSILAREIISRIAPMFKMPSAADALAYLGSFRFLAAVRKGPHGVQAINAMIEEVLKHQALIPGDYGQWYPFRPLMITSNDYLNELFNGDVGIVQRADHDPRQIVGVVFEDGRGGHRRLAPHQLPSHETVFAMTVHKSQGSEFDHVFLILPDHDVPVLTRELIYTAVTRARKSVTIWGDPDLLTRAIDRRIQRASGLREVLWGK